MEDKTKNKHTNMIKRLDGFYGAVCEKQNRRIAEGVKGEKILEVGCGYGSLVELLSRKGFWAMGIDIDKEAIELGKQRYRDTNIRYMNVDNAEFNDEKFDCVIFRETAHHLDFDATLTKLKSSINGQIIVFDPNPNLLVKLCRKLVGHIDPELSYLKTMEIFKRHNFKINILQFSDIVAFPLSGGFVGKSLMPSVKLFWSILLQIDEILLRILRVAKVQRHFCWRYMIVATKDF